MLDELVATTAWSRAKTRRAVTTAAARKGPQRAVKRGLAVSELRSDPNPTRNGMRLTGASSTIPGPLLRTSIMVYKAGDEHEGGVASAHRADDLIKRPDHVEFNRIGERIVADVHRVADVTQAHVSRTSFAPVTR